jgi:hypothetical protein
MVNPLDPNYHDKRVYSSEDDNPLIAPNKPFKIKPLSKSDGVYSDSRKKKKGKNGQDEDDDDDQEVKPLPRPMGL